MKRKRVLQAKKLTQFTEDNGAASQGDNSNLKEGTDSLQDCLFYDCLYSPVNDAVETEELVATKVQEVKEKIDEVLSTGALKKEGFLTVLEQQSKETQKEIQEYVKNHEFLLAFLRAEGFDSSRAASRLGRFVQYKTNLFGVRKLSHQIKQDDLNDDDRKLLLAGVFHIDEVDCGGRLVVFFHLSRLRSLGFLNENYAASIARVAFYLVMFAMKYNQRWDQSKGAVVIRYGLNSTLPLKHFRILFTSFLRMMTWALPITFAAAHIFYNNALEHSCFQFTQLIVPKRILCKIKLHNATSPAACLSSLGKYGIDAGALPINMAGEFRTNFYLNAVKQIRMRELYLPALALLEEKYNKSNHEDDAASSSTASSDIPEIFQTTKSEQHQNEEAGIISTTAKDVQLTKTQTEEDVQTEHFPSQLMEILQSSATNTDAIWWSRGGTAFIIDRQKFSTTVLPKQFSGVKMDSFLRRLRRWKFQRLTNKGQAVGSNRIEYQHRLFQKDKPHLLEGWEIAEPKLPSKLMKVVEDDKYSNSIWWLPNGQAFAIDMKQLSCDVAVQKDNPFEGVKVSSLLRLLRKWGFQRLSQNAIKESTTTCKNDDTNNNNSGNNVLVFQHELFQKNTKLPHTHQDTWASHYSDNVGSNNVSSLTFRENNSIIIASVIKAENFPKKLHRILRSSDHNHAIWWQDDAGTSFVIQEEEFARDVLPKEYGIKFRSFKRNLNRWKFKKTNADPTNLNLSVYSHPSFRRDSPELLNNWEENN